MSKVYVNSIFDRLTVVKDTGRRDSCRQIIWECKCSCGNTTFVPTRSLTGGKTRSCGCISSERAKQGINRKHNLCYSKLYSVWSNMKTRCSNPNSQDYQNYGDRGIKICDEWLHDFQPFYDWAMSHDYSPELTLDRSDNDGDYTPDNCRWVTRYVQGNNKRNNPRVEYKGESHTLPEWSKLTGIHYMTLRNRILYLGWSVSTALETPTRSFTVRKEGI